MPLSTTTEPCSMCSSRAPCQPDTCTAAATAPGTGQQGRHAQHFSTTSKKHNNVANTVCRWHASTVKTEGCVHTNGKIVTARARPGGSSAAACFSVSLHATVEAHVGHHSAASPCTRRKERAKHGVHRTTGGGARGRWVHTWCSKARHASLSHHDAQPIVDQAQASATPVIQPPSKVAPLALQHRVLHDPQPEPALIAVCRSHLPKDGACCMQYAVGLQPSCTTSRPRTCTHKQKVRRHNTRQAVQHPLPSLAVPTGSHAWSTTSHWLRSKAKAAAVLAAVG